MKKRPLLVGLALAAAAGAAVSTFPLWRAGRADLPTVRVARGSLDLSVHTTGELRSGRSAMVTAPSANAFSRLESAPDSASPCARICNC